MLTDRHENEEKILELVKQVNNGRAKVGIGQWMIMTAPLLLAIIASVATVGLWLGKLESELNTLQAFARSGERFTAREGAVLENRVKNVENWIIDAPPQWFRNEVDKLEAVVSEMATDLTALTIELRTAVALTKRNIS